MNRVVCLSLLWVGIYLGGIVGPCRGSRTGSSSDSQLLLTTLAPAEPGVHTQSPYRPSTMNDEPWSPDGSPRISHEADELLSSDVTSSSGLGTSTSSRILPRKYLSFDAMPFEGCSLPASMEWIQSKNNKPISGNVASNAIDGKASTWWSSMGRSKWIEVGFSGGEGGEFKVEGVAIAFYNGDRRVAFLDVSEYISYT